MGVLADLEDLHQQVSEFSRLLLREYVFGDDVALTHQILIEPTAEAVRLISNHLLTISIGPDFIDSREVDISASISIGESVCSAHFQIQGESCRGDGGAGEEVCVIRKKSDASADLGVAVRFLRKILESLEYEADPLGGLAELRV
ncbi:hypothetical protein OHR86_00110 [Streptomyces sp. NBC_00441]|uniref:hypothetical protein n=1 Tax=Streptomyces sp. NBC_00441 TaxID=2975742 RepID=UPI002E29CE63|nr:hypothetical protein [Streptomyces sp. NBC_00441]